MTRFWLVFLVWILGQSIVEMKEAVGKGFANWRQVREQTTCEAMPDENCLGRYGFAVSRDGSYLAGPSPEGTKSIGQIQPGEMQQLEALMLPLSPEALGGQANCTKGGSPGIRDQVDVTFQDQSIVRIYDLGGSVGQLCIRGSRPEVERLHEYLHKLMARYYPVPFARN